MECKFHNDSKNGAVLNIKLVPNSNKNTIYKEVVYFNNNAYIKAAVTSIAADNLANLSLINLLSKFFKIPKSSIKITKGEKSQYKSILFSNISSAYILQKLEVIK